MDVETPTKIGPLAKASGVTVRTLHHWDDIGLLSPSRRNASGHREYTDEDVSRLYQILALRQLGLELHTIATCLDSGVDLRHVVADHLVAVEETIATMNALLDRLRRIDAELVAGGQPSVASMIEVIEAIDDLNARRDRVLHKYLNDEQLARMQDAAAVIDPTIYSHYVTVEWPALYAKAEALRVAGALPSDAAVQDIVARMDELSAMLSGGDTNAGHGVRSAWREDPAAMSGDPHAPTTWRDLADFVEAARARRSSTPA